MFFVQGRGQKCHFSMSRVRAKMSFVEGEVINTNYLASEVRSLFPDFYVGFSYRTVLANGGLIQQVLSTVTVLGSSTDSPIDLVLMEGLQSAK